MPFNATHWNPRFQTRLAKYQRSMLRRPSPIETKMASYLREMGIPFEQQKIMDRHIVDFYLPTENLIVEVDGKHHEKRKEKDSERDIVLRSRGHHVLHIQGWQVYRKEVAIGLLKDSIAALTASRLGSAARAN